MQWTSDQWKAISAKDGTLLVSAAAGSGKTAVLVERVVSRLEDKEKGCKAEELLIVTFTKAATAQMREKISKAMQKRIDADPTNTHLLRQQSRLPFAHISTIDSFCADIVRENFQKLGIEPDYTIADANRMELIRQETAEEIAEDFYAQGDTAFEYLSELLFQGRDDQKLISTILDLDTQASAYPDPEQWLQDLYASYRDVTSPDDSVFGVLARQAASRVLEACMASTENAMELVTQDDDVASKYIPFLAEEKAGLESLLEKIRTLPWDAAREAALRAAEFLPSRCPTVRGNDSFEKNAAKDVHNKNKDRLKKRLPSLFCTSAAEFCDDAAYCLPYLKKLSEAVLRFRQALMEKKKAENAYEFSDISLFALQCLTDEHGGASELAKSLSERFAEILIDEFQDVNEAQYRLFMLLSKNGENLFMVGDAKQSIYKFRQARPDIFIGLKKKYPLYIESNYPSTVLLGQNFRSRAGVTQWVNYTFRQIMYDNQGDAYEVNYDESEYLHPSAVYPPVDRADAELHLLQTGTEEEQILSEARYIAQYILTQMQNGLTVSDGEIVRPAAFKDFCILIRSDGGRIEKISKVLASCGIPAQAGTRGGFFEAPEIAFAVSLLQVLDNPLLDVPMLSVMLSPVFGFTPSDLTALRVQDRRSSLYALLCANAEQDERIRAFLDALANLRMLASTLSSGELIRRILDETGYLAVVGAMHGGESRQANLMQLQRFAAQYEQSGRIGLSGFVRFLDKLQANNSEPDKPSTPTGADLVQIMTIHKSKGLEFPVCILANCSGRFNVEEFNNKYICHNQYGMATVRRDAQTMAEYETLAKNVLTTKAKESSINEELRVLYVAMTRAKEKLVAIVSMGGSGKKLPELAMRSGGEKGISGGYEWHSYGELLLCAAVRHPDAHALREWMGARLQTMEADFRLQVVVADAPSVEEEPAVVYSERKADETLMQEIQKRTGYVYPFAPLSAVNAKRTASESEKSAVDRTFFASTRPAFLNAGGLTPAQRGTALHRFLQHMRFREAAEDLDSEIDRLLESGLLSEQECAVLPKDAIHRFLNSETGRRIIQADVVYRERQFALQVSACSVYPDLPKAFSEETVVIQGMVDCAFVEDGKLVIVDYKTDKASPEVLRERYRVQLETYRSAMESCAEEPVGDVLLYSFHNHSTIEI